MEDTRRPEQKGYKGKKKREKGAEATLDLLLSFCLHCLPHGIYVYEKGRKHKQKNVPWGFVLVLGSFGCQFI
jgi:hypothetical protein